MGLISKPVAIYKHWSHIRQSSTILWMSILLVISLVVRIWIVAFIIGFNQTDLPSDDQEFEGIGWTLAQTGRYAEYPDTPPTARRSPILPLLLAGIYSVVGHQRAVAQGVLVLVSAAIAPVTFLLAKEVDNRRRVGLLAGLWVAFDPFLLIFAGVFYSETLFTFFLTLSILLLLRVVKHPRPRSLVLLGIALGCCALTRSNGLIIAVGAVALLLMIGPGPFTASLRRATVVSAIVILLVTPWVVRNFIVFNRFIPTTAQLGEVLLGFYNETCLQYRCNEWIGVYLLPEYTEYHLADLDEMTRNDMQLQLALSTIRAYPMEWFALLPAKVTRFWMHDNILPNTSYRSNPPSIFILFQRIYYRVLLLLGLAGLFILYLTNQRQAFITFTLLVAIFSLMVLIFWGDARLRMPLHPMLSVAGAYALEISYTRIFLSTELQQERIGE